MSIKINKNKYVLVKQIKLPSGYNLCHGCIFYINNTNCINRTKIVMKNLACGTDLIYKLKISYVLKKL